MDRQTFAAPPALELSELTYRRDGSEIIRGVSVTVRAGGRALGHDGPNGAGKSTLPGFCGAVTRPTSGTVRVPGEQLGRVEPQALRRAIGHVNRGGGQREGFVQHVGKARVARAFPTSGAEFTRSSRPGSGRPRAGSRFLLLSMVDCWQAPGGGHLSST